MDLTIISNALNYVTIISDVFIVAILLIILAYWSLNNRLSFNNVFFQYIGKNFLLFSFIVTLVATLGSLFYSEIMGYSPCELCWYQRVLMYPQVILFGTAMFRKDMRIAIYSLALSIPGLALAGFHYISQISASPVLSCSIVGYAASCTQNFFTFAGYVTIPMMSVTAFALLIIFQISHLKNKKE